MAVNIDELQIVVIVDKEKVLATRRIEPFSIRLGQGHAGIETADVAIVDEAWVFAPGHSVLCINAM